MTSVFETAPSYQPVTQSPEAAAKGDPGTNGAGFDFSFLVGLGASLGTLADGLAQDRAERRAREKPPGDNQIFRADVVPSSGVLTLDLGSVPLGHVWQVRRLVVGGVKVTTTAAGSAYAFAQGAPPTDLALTDCVDMFLTLPQGNTYGTHQLFLLGGEHLYVVFSGATAAQQYAASARVEDWEDTTFRSTFAE